MNVHLDLSHDEAKALDTLLEGEIVRLVGIARGTEDATAWAGVMAAARRLRAIEVQLSSALDPLLARAMDGDR